MTAQSIISQGGTPAGFHVTYAEDTVIGDGWFADLRDELGRVRESGGGHTQEAARARLLERIARDPLADIDRMPAPAGPAPVPALDAMIAELISQGYHVSFTEGFGAEPFGAHVEKPGDPDAGCTALGYTAQAALAAALPEAVGESLTATLPAPSVADDLRTLSADLEDFNNRLDDLEDRFSTRDQATNVLIRVLAHVLRVPGAEAAPAAGDAGKD